MEGYKGVLGLSGSGGSGKTTVAAELVRNGWKRVKMASGLKSMLTALYKEAGFSDAGIFDRLEGCLKEEPCDMLGGQTPRFAMQELGTSWGRVTIHGDLWTEIAKGQIEAHLKNGFNVVVDDIRFDNEAKVIHDLGGLIAEVERDGAGLEHEHVSERGIVSDMTFENNGSKADLIGKTKYIFLMSGE